MLAKAYSASIVGVDAFTVEIEVNATMGGESPVIAMVGLPDAAVRESRERVKSALSASNFGQPWGYTTINLAPADVKKEGAAFDLPIALGMMAAIGEFDTEILVKSHWQGTPIIAVPTKVHYPSDGVSHFRAVNDNARISWMHTRLFFGMLIRLPGLLSKKRALKSNSPTGKKHE